MYSLQTLAAAVRSAVAATGPCETGAPAASGGVARPDGGRREGGRTVGVPRQEAITTDDVVVTAAAVVRVTVTDAERARRPVDDVDGAVSNLAAATLRAVLGEETAETALAGPASLGARVHERLDDLTDEWGVRVEGVEIREIERSTDDAE